MSYILLILIQNNYEDLIIMILTYYEPHTYEATWKPFN